ncbi:hypothetical protein RJT34_07656 [Clitoria ternatea]|uniref:Uncharacterized protein n=1 Tax=Clitoria ternatea TaxID=43366 RepID=A0AAN9K2U8_CLITE
MLQVGNSNSWLIGAGKEVFPKETIMAKCIGIKGCRRNWGRADWKMLHVIKVFEEGLTLFKWEGSRFVFWTLLVVVVRVLKGWVMYGGCSNDMVNYWEKGEKKSCEVLNGHKLVALCVALAMNYANKEREMEGGRNNILRVGEWR